MKDRLGRKIDYLRISVTQNCNLRCIYCMPAESTAITRCRDDITPLEYGQVVRAMAGLGIRKVRFTGGEPLLRQDLNAIINETAKINGIEDISLTTNGVLLGRYAKDLKEAGLQRVNISLDSLDAAGFYNITGGDKLQDVMAGIDAAVAVGLQPVRINTVLIKGINDHEADAFMDLAKNRPVNVRFIELMPVGDYGEQNRDRIVYNDELLAARSWLTPDYESSEGNPARYYTAAGYEGKIGFISPMGHRFCHLCNRIRLTWDGKLKPCLGDNGEIDLMGAVRKKNDITHLKQIISRTIYNKPEGHSFGQAYQSQRDMSRIGG